MNSYERVMNTMQGKPVDRAPVFGVLGAYGGRLAGIPLPKLYQEPMAWVAGQIKVQARFKLDLVLGHFAFAIVAEAFGGKVAYFENQAPNMKRQGMESAQEFLDSELPKPHNTECLRNILTGIAELKTLYGGKVPIASTIPGPCALPVLIIGMEKWLEIALFEPEMKEKVLEYSSIFWNNWAMALLNEGADFLVCTEGMASESISTREVFATHFLNHLEECFAKVDGPLVMHHTGGSINHVLDLLNGLPNLAGVVISSKDSISVAREKLGPGPTIIGNLDNLSYPSMSLEKMNSLAREKLQEAEGLGPFILCNSAADIPIETEEAVIDAMIEAGNKLYPLKTVPNNRGQRLCVACSVLRKEIEHLISESGEEIEKCFLPSRLHMEPPRLERALQRIRSLREGPINLVYGDCCPSMLQIEAQEQTQRTQRVNCCQMLLGKERYRELIKNGAFFLLPEWAPKWKHIMECELGLSCPTTRDLLKERCTEIVYVDSGLIPVPHELLRECEDYTGLPVRVEAVDLEHLKDALTEIGMLGKEAAHAR